MASNLLEELANLHNPAPASFDPEDAGREDIFGAPAGAAGGEAAEGEIAARGQRTHRVKRLDEDPKYRGRKTSRRALDAWATGRTGNAGERAPVARIVKPDQQCVAAHSALHLPLHL